MKGVVLEVDNVGEYTSLEFKEYLVSEGIEHKLTILGQPEQNGVAKYMNRTLTERTRSMIISCMSEDFWAEAVSQASYTVNRSPSTTVNLQIP